jgi:hypothetical protein
VQVKNNRAKLGGGVAVCEKGHLIIKSFDVDNHAEIANNYAKYAGGGICIFNSGVCKLIDGNIENNTAESSGGGISVGHFSNDNRIPYFYMYGGSIKSNKALSDSGGGIEIKKNSHCEITGGIIFFNMAECCGGGIMVKNGYCKFDNAVLHGNEAIWGGGISVLNESFTENKLFFEMLGGEISGNIAKNYGGGIELKINKYDDEDMIQEKVPYHLVLSSGIISGNIVTDGYGGGIAINGGDCLLKGNIVICGNSATKYGGGVSVNRNFSRCHKINLTVKEFASIAGNIVGQRNTHRNKTDGTIDNYLTIGNGGGIGIFDGKVFLEGGEIRGNVAEKGGGIYIAGKEEIKNNGGIETDGELAERLVVSGGVIEGNSIDNIHCSNDKEVLQE